jgi:hypothetical protein
VGVILLKTKTKSNLSQSVDYEEMEKQYQERVADLEEEIKLIPKKCIHTRIMLRVRLELLKSRLVNFRKEIRKAILKKRRNR